MAKAKREHDEARNTLWAGQRQARQAGAASAPDEDFCDDEDFDGEDFDDEDPAAYDGDESELYGDDEFDGDDEDLASGVADRPSANGDPFSSAAAATTRLTFPVSNARPNLVYAEPSDVIEHTFPSVSSPGACGARGPRLPESQVPMASPEPVRRPRRFWLVPAGLFGWE